MRAIPLAGLLSLTLLAGCVQDGENGRLIQPECDGAAMCLDPSIPPHVVVADIDTGINVYHDAFRVADGGTLPPALIDSFVDSANGRPPQRITLTQAGSFEERLEADQGIWDNMTRGTLYYFEGTRILGISFRTDQNDENPVLDYPDGSHGTGTAGSVIDANPEAIIVLVEGVGSAEGELWAMAQPWVDVTTMSYGPIGSPPTSATEETGTHAATRQGWRSGKVPVGAADNTPSLAPNDATAGPPWVIGVAGDHIGTQCRDHVSGTFPDVTANFTQTLPEADSTDARGPTSGTSFSTPTTAGTLSAIILGVRQAWNHLDGIVDGALAVSPDGQRFSNGDLRTVMNNTAYYFAAADCEVTVDTGLPVNPVAPYLQMGWGHVGPEIVGDALAKALSGELSPWDEDARRFQEALYDYRIALWGEP